MQAYMVANVKGLVLDAMLKLNAARPEDPIGFLVSLLGEGAVGVALPAPQVAPIAEFVAVSGTIIVTSKT